MLEVLQKVFKDKVASPAWQQKLHQIVPSYGTHLNDDPARVQQEWAYTSEVLQLAPPPGIDTQAPQQSPATDPIGQKHNDSDPDLAP
jgi:malate dehydrogenase (quinone)